MKLPVHSLSVKTIGFVELLYLLFRWMRCRKSILCVCIEVTKIVRSSHKPKRTSMRKITGQTLGHRADCLKQVYLFIIHLFIRVKREFQ